jgi:hypothetical protein
MPSVLPRIVVAALLLLTLPLSLEALEASNTSPSQDAPPGLVRQLQVRIENLSRIVDELAGKGFDVGAILEAITRAKDTLAKTPPMRGEEARAVAQVMTVLQRLERLLSRIGEIIEERPELAGQSIEILNSIEAIYARGDVNSLAVSLLESGRGLVDDALSPGLDPGQAVSLLSRARTLAMAARQVIEGGPVSLKVSKGGDSEGGSNTEVNIAHILTTSQDIKVYQSEERTSYENETIVVVRRTIISVGNMTIIEREISRTSDGNGVPGLRAMEFTENVAMGAVIGLKKGAGNRVNVEKTEFDVSLEGFSTDANIIRLVLSAPDGTPGRLLVVDIDRNVARGLLIKEVAVRLDGKQVQIAESITDILHGNPQEPKYFIALTGSGIQLVIYVPKWSTRVITIGAAAAQAFYFPVAELAGNNVQWLATAAATAVLIFIVFVGRLRRVKTRDIYHMGVPDSF